MISLNKTIPSSIDTITYRFWCPGRSTRNEIDIAKGTDKSVINHIACTKYSNSWQVFIQVQNMK